MTVTSNATVASVTFNSASSSTATLTVNSGWILTVTGGITNQNNAAASTSVQVQGAGTINCAVFAVGGTTTPTAANSSFSATLTCTVSNLNISGNLTVRSLYNSTQSSDNIGTLSLGSGLVNVGGSIAFVTVPLYGPIFNMETGSESAILNLSNATPFTFTGGGSSTFDPSGTNSTVIYSGTTETVYAGTSKDLSTYIGYQNLTLAGSGVKTTTGITVNGTLLMQGTATASAAQTNGPKTTLVYNGSTAQTAGPELTATLPNLVISNADGVTLAGNTTITNLLTLANGLLVTGAKTVTLGASASISGGSAASYVNGNLQKTFNTGTQTFSYPIGDATSYTPVALSGLAVSSSGSLKAATTSGNHPQIATSGINANLGVNRYWTLTQSGGTFGTYNTTFNYPSANVDAGAVPAQFAVAQWNANAWSAETVSGTPTTTSTSITGTSGFGDFVIGDPGPAAAGVLQWTDASTRDTNWSTALNWTNLTSGGVGSPNLTNSVVFTNQASMSASALTSPGSGVVVPANINSYVDTSISTGSLTNYASALSSSPNYQNIGIAAGATLTCSNLQAGGYNVFDLGSNNVSNLTISGAGAALQLNGGSIYAIEGSTNSGTHNAVLDLSGLDLFVMNGFQIRVGVEGGVDGSKHASGTLYLAKTNTITVNGTGYINTGVDGGSPYSGNPAFYIGHNLTSFGIGSQIYLGVSNSIYTDYATIGRGDTNDLLAFNPAFLSLNPSVYLRGTNGDSTRVSVYVIGDGSPGGQANASSTNDFSGGTVDAMIDYLCVGRGREGNNSLVGGSGVLTFNQGTINANNLVVGLVYASASNSPASGIVNVNGTGNLIVNNNLILAQAANVAGQTAIPQGVLNVKNGTVAANAIVAGGGISTITLTNGTLIVTNTAGTPASVLSSVSLTNSTLQFTVTGTTTNLVVTNLVTGGTTNLINIAALPNINSYPTQFTVVDYAGSIGGTGFNIGLGSLPSANPAYQGYLSNNTAKSSIVLVLTPPPTKLAITSVNGGSSPSVSAPFNVVVQSQDSGGTAQNVSSDTAVTLSLNTGSGTLAGTLTGTITAGTNTVTISGATYSKAESGVSLTATRTSGDSLTAGNSSSFTVLPGNQTITFPSPGNQTYGVAPITLTATASSGLTVSYSITSGLATVSSNLLTITGAGSVTIQASQAGNANWNAATPVSQTISVAPKTVTGGITVSNKVYDRTTNASIATRTLTGVINSDVVNLSGGTASFADKNVGTGKTVMATGLSLTGANAGNYVLLSTSATNTANITQDGLTVSGVTANNKTYDGTTNATLNLGSAALAGVISGDTVTLNTTGATGSFANKTVATGKTVTVSGLTISGADSTNYSLAQPTTTANITAKGLTVSGVTANNKVYDSTTNATLNLGSAALVGVVSGDSVTLNTGSATGSFADKNVGTNKTVAVNGLTTGGTDATNYSLSQPTTTANISSATLTVSATGVNKVYDATTNATVTLSDNHLAGDSVTDNYSKAGFGDKNVGTNKAVNVFGISISGADSANYAANTTAATTANITGAALTVSATGVNKVYDATTNATVNLSDDRIAGDVLTTSYTSASFADKNVGVGKIVSVTGISVTGSDAGNYAYNTATNTTASIIAATLTVSADNKSRDYGVPNPLLTASYSGFVGGESSNVLTGSPSLSTTATPTSPVGAYPITVGVGSLSAANYTFNFNNGTLAIIEVPAILTISSSPGMAGQTNQMTISCAGLTPGNYYNILASTDLISWSQIGTQQAAQDGTMAFTDTNSIPTRFYRLSTN